MTVPVKIPPITMRKIIEILEDGGNVTEAAKAYGVSRITLANSLKRHNRADLNKTTSPYCKRMTPEDIEKAKALVASGKCQADAARAIGFSPSALGKVLNGKGKGRPKGAKKVKPEGFDRSSPEEHVRLNNRYLTTLSMRSGA